MTSHRLVMMTTTMTNDDDDDDARDGSANVVATSVDEREGRPFSRARGIAGDARRREGLGGAARDADARVGRGRRGGGGRRARARCTCARASARSTTGGWGTRWIL